MVYPGMIPGMPPPMGVPPFAVSARANLARSSQPFIGEIPQPRRLTASTSFRSTQGAPMMPPPGVPLPPGIVPPPAAPVVAPAADPAADPAAASEQAPAKESTTVYVGKIPPSVDDALVRKLLDACGEVRSWKRVMDPENDTPKRFGFCEFADAEGVLRAMRILDGFPVAGEELLLNVNQATKAYVEGYTEKRTVTAEEDASVDAERRAVLEAAVASAGHAAEAEAFLGAMALRPTTNVSSAAATASTRPNPPPPPLPLGGAFGAPKFVAARDPDSIAPPPPDGGAGGVEAPQGGARGAPGTTNAPAANRKDDERRERARRDAERREREERARLDREHRERERRVERVEADRARDARRERERARDVERDRLRDVDDDDATREPEEAAAERALKDAGIATPTPEQTLEMLVALGPPAWVRDERARERRRRYREREREGDANDRKAEEEELSAARARDDAKAKEDAERAAKEAAEREAAVKKAEEEAAAVKAEEEANREASPANAAPAPLFAKKPTKKTAGGKRKLSVFAVEDEEQRPKKALVPIEYTVEELAAAAAPASTMAEDDEDDPAAAAAAAAKRAAAVIAKKNRAEKEEKARGSLIESIPTDKKKLFKYDVDWRTYDASNLSGSVQRWVSKKVAELLGEEEPSLVEFVVEKVGEHLSAKDMVSELEPVLDNEAEPFVIKLWRMLIYETLKANEKA